MFFFGGLLFFSLFVFADDYAGTPPRIEREYKLAFVLEKNQRIKSLTDLIEKSLKKTLATEELKFDEYVHGEYRIEESFQPFAFEDTYLDTNHFDVLKSQSSYRLRYRWTRYEYYLRYQLFSFLSVFYPSRCEIQYKDKYQLDPKNGIVEVTETRFEFRNESHPFQVAYDAPLPPWPYQRFLNYAQSGQYKKYRMLPYHKLQQRINNSKLMPVMKVLTQRNRLHLSVAHPWGWGPNPDQVFIVTLDKSYFTNLHNHQTYPKQLIEIEIEPERNTTTFLEKYVFRSSPLYLSDNETSELLKESAKKARIYLESDLQALRRVIELRISKKIRSQKLPLNYKYARMCDLLRLGQ